MDRRSKAVFLDRDGTISVEKGYIKNADDLELIEKAGDALFELIQNGYKLIVITNQAGVARGYFTENEVEEVNKRLIELLSEKQVTIDSIYYCPHYPDPEKTPAKDYLVDCNCRKPKTGNVKKAVDKHGIELSESFFIGDKASDVWCGKNAGMKTVLVKTGYGKDEEIKLRELPETEQPDYYAEDLSEAVNWILKKT